MHTGTFSGKFADVTERRAAEGERRRNWTQWMKEWNRRQRARRRWQFGDASAFRRTFLRAERAFLPRDVLEALASGATSHDRTE